MFYIKHKTLGILVFKTGMNPRYLGHFAQCIDYRCFNVVSEQRDGLAKRADEAEEKIAQVAAKAVEPWREALTELWKATDAEDVI